MQPRYPKPSSCGGCSLERAGFGFALPSGPAGSRLTFVGEALGYEEAIAGEPFYGSAGGVLSRICQRAGIDRRTVRIANVCSCRPPNDYLVGAPWEDHAVQQCRQYLQPVLDLVPPDAVVVTLGATALTAVMELRGHAGIAVKDWHGTISRDPSNRFWVVPTFHPSHLQRGSMNLLEVVTQDLRLADRIAQRGFQRSPVELVVDPHPEWFAQWIAGYLQRLAQDPEGVHLALDTEFAEKAGGADESEVILGDTRSPITRINGSIDTVVGWTVPYRQPYIGLVHQLLTGVTTHRGWVWLWNKYADLDHLWAAHHPLPSEIAIDAMWLWHYLQSDLPRGLGFVAPMASDFGPWKHWAKDPAKEGPYAAADGVQTWRTAMWMLKSAVATGVWDLFLRDWHDRDVYVLRPAHVLGTPVNRSALEAFHIELQEKLARVLERMKTTAAQGVLKPKLGYAKRPKGAKCLQCALRASAPAESVMPDTCPTCGGAGEMPPTPPASILGKPKKGGGEAKSQYMLEGVQLVEKDIEIEVTNCNTCNGTDVGAKHRCPLPKKPKQPKRHRAGRDGHERDGGRQLGDAGGAAASDSGLRVRPVADLVRVRVVQRRYFWQLPFNPDAPAQVLQYLADRGIAAPVDKKKQRATTNKKALKDLQKQHRDDPFFQLQLDWKAVQKVDSTYAVGALTRMDGNDRLHPEFLPKPSTFRDSCVGVNLQNVVADKAGPDGLASGFRRCVEARDGLPPGATEDDYLRWQLKWGGADV